MLEKDIAFVLVDLRPSKAAQKGHIKGAVSVSMKELPRMKDRFPADKSAPIVIYGDGDLTDAFKTVRGWGYPNVSLLNGGIEGWKKEGGGVATGKLAKSITYEPKPRPGEIAIEEFKTIVEKGTPGVQVIDVRDSDEAINGMLKGAINIPAGQILERIAELPKDKLLVTHCVTGIRAESAYDDLKEKGYNVKFLNAVIQIDKDGKYEITKK